MKPLQLIFLFLSVAVFAQTPKVYKAPKFESTWHLPSKHPDRIVINLGQNPETSASVTWTRKPFGFSVVADACEIYH